jgi:hypothetical protein
MLMHLLLDANQEHRETVVFGAGVELTIPSAPGTRPATLPPWMR